MRAVGWAMRLSSIVAGVALAVAAIAGLQSFAPGSRAETVQTTAAATAEEAVQQHLQGRGLLYAGACDATRSPQDIGKVCSRYIEAQAGVRAYMVGRTFSEFDTWLFADQAAGGWTVVASVPLDFHDMTGMIPWPE